MTLLLACMCNDLTAVFVVSFSLHDIARNGVITRHEVRTILDSSLKKENLVFTPEQLNGLIDQTFEEASDEGDKLDNITFPQYEKLCRAHPMMLTMFTLPQLDTLFQEGRENAANDNEDKTTS